MKRVAIVVLAIAALVSLGSPSVPLTDVSSCYASTSKATTGAAAIAPSTGGGDETAGPSGNGGTGGSNQGDADGLSGFRGTPTIQTEFGAQGYTVDRVLMLVGMWWKLMIWIR
jgi:hypothetical protein